MTETPWANLWSALIVFIIIAFSAYVGVSANKWLHGTEIVHPVTPTVDIDTSDIEETLRYIAAVSDEINRRAQANQRSLDAINDILVGIGWQEDY